VLDRDSGPMVGTTTVVAIWALAIVTVFSTVIGCIRKHPGAFMEAEVLNCLKEGRLDEASEKADLWVKKFGDDPVYGYVSYRTRATIHARRGEIECAIHDLTAAIDRVWSHSEPVALGHVIARGRCKEHLGRMQAAGDDYQRAYEGYLSYQIPPGAERRGERCIYMSVIDFFWTHRQETDKAFGFEQLKFDRTGSHREDKRIRRKAVLQWMLRFIDVHKEIIANVDDVDVEVIPLASETQNRTE